MVSVQRNLCSIIVWKQDKSPFTHRLPPNQTLHRRNYTYTQSVTLTNNMSAQETWPQNTHLADRMCICWNVNFGVKIWREDIEILVYLTSAMVMGDRKTLLNVLNLNNGICFSMSHDMPRKSWFLLNRSYCQLYRMIGCLVSLVSSIFVCVTNSAFSLLQTKYISIIYFVSVV